MQYVIVKTSSEPANMAVCSPGIVPALIEWIGQYIHASTNIKAVPLSVFYTYDVSIISTS